ncbi:MAG: YafY family transcriptional regulator [Alphaproteobacteria bacterium]|nr:YafY family transcriptional regulator [Alphaproteobacteria bacterium]MBU2270851.1 YafY family transcriptional regulator [Alphaproteobacteria bacterium]MBU2418832.1 YafY family transcriptional regulator [Alphaproteobacteria bacterium]
MRRADRLFQIIQVLRRSSKPVTADAMAAELETSKRSIYRDIATLMAQRVPIRGEAGIGYVLDGGFDMPPLMLTSDEIEAAVLGAQWVAGRGDPALARAATDLIAKIAATVPDKLRPVLLEPAVATPPAWKHEIETLDLALVRAAIHAGRKLRMRYADEQGQETLRVIWPCLIGYRETKRLLVGWCETREDFRSFRTDRVVEAEVLDDRYPGRPAVLRARWFALMERQRAEWEARCSGAAAPPPADGGVV